jgi:hypothetical protein
MTAVKQYTENPVKTIEGFSVKKKAPFTIKELEIQLDKIERVEISEFEGHDLQSRSKHKAELMRSLTKGYIINKLAKDFAVIDDKNLLTLKRWILLRFPNGRGEIVKDSMSLEGKQSYTKDKVPYRWVEAPLVVQREFSRNTWGPTYDELVSERLASSDTPGAGGSSNQTWIYSKQPCKINRSQWDKVDKFRSKVLQYQGELVTCKTASELLWDRLSITCEDIEFKLWWIPPLEALYLKEEPNFVGDPAMVATFFDTTFLLDMWETEEEIKLNHLIEEFI